MVRGCVDRIGLGPSLQKGPAPGVGARRDSACLRALLALPVPIYSDLKDDTEPVVSGMTLDHRIFRNGGHLTTYRSHPPTLDYQDNFCSFPLDSMTQMGTKQ